MAPRTILTLLLLSSTIAIHGEPLKISVLSVETSVTATAAVSGVNCSQSGASSVSIDCGVAANDAPHVLSSASAQAGSLAAAGSLAGPLPLTPFMQSATASFSENVLVTGAAGAGYLGFVIFPIGFPDTGSISVSVNGQSFSRSFRNYAPIYMDGLSQFQFGAPFDFSESITETMDKLPPPYPEPPDNFLTITPALLAYQIFDRAPAYCGPPPVGEPPRTPLNGPCSGASLAYEGSLLAPEPSTLSLMLIAALVVSWISRRRRTAVRATPPDTSSNPDAAAF